MKKAVVSVPNSQIHSLSAEDESGRLSGHGFFPSSHLVINIAYGEFEFRGAGKAHKTHNLIMGHMV
jgi:hypothetical protein